MLIKNSVWIVCFYRGSICHAFAQGNVDMSKLLASSSGIAKAQVSPSPQCQPNWRLGHLVGCDVSRSPKNYRGVRLGTENGGRYLGKYPLVGRTT